MDDDSDGAGGWINVFTHTSLLKLIALQTNMKVKKVSFLCVWIFWSLSFPHHHFWWENLLKFLFLLLPFKKLENCIHFINAVLSWACYLICVSCCFCMYILRFVFVIKKNSEILNDDKCDPQHKNDDDCVYVWINGYFLMSGGFWGKGENTHNTYLTMNCILCSMKGIGV